MYKIVNYKAYVHKMYIIKYAITNFKNEKYKNISSYIKRITQTNKNRKFCGKSGTFLLEKKIGRKIELEIVITEINSQ